LSHNGRNDNDDDDPWQLPHLMPTDSEQQPLQAPSYASRRSSSQRKKPESLSDDEQPPWAPGVWARLPYSGLAALIGVLLRMSCPLSTWPCAAFPPNYFGVVK
jgi:hypothetical protein